MIDYNGNWLPTVTFGVPAVLATCAILLGLIFLALYKAVNNNDPELFWIFGTLAIIGLLSTGIGSAFGYYPYKADYHKLQPVSGTVKTIDSRFLATSQYLVVTYETGLSVRCDDSRCSTVREGDKLNLLCTKTHEFGSPLEVDGWVCRWGKQ